MMERKHRLRAVRNLAAAVLLLLLFWWLYGCPLPTREMEFRRDERQHLVGRSDIIFTCESEGETISGDPMMLVGVTERTVHTRSRTHPFNIWPKNPEGATLVVLPSELEYKEKLVAGLVAVEPPALAERAQLTVYWPFDIWYDGEKVVVTAEGERTGAVFLFRMEETEEVPYDKIMRLFHTTRATDLPPYTLEFFNGDGALLETVTNMA